MSGGRAGWLALIILAAPTMALAAPSAYRFEAVSSTLTRGVAVTILVRVSPVDGGRVLPRFAVREASVSPAGGGGAGVRPAFFEPSLDYGLLRFRADLPTRGDWALAFTLQAAGEPDVAGGVNLKVGDPASAAAPGRSPR